MVEQPATEAHDLRVPRVQLPLALAAAHLELRPGDAFELVVSLATDDPAGAAADGADDRSWRPDDLAPVLAGAGFEFDEMVVAAGTVLVRATRLRTLPDMVGPDMRLLVCGLNPSLYAADRGVGYARPGNRFWPAALEAGLVARDRDPLHALTAGGVGMTDLVKRATVGAAELTADEYRQGAARVERLVRWLRPAGVCFVGLAGWRAVVDANAVAGLQPRPFGGRPAYVMPSTSGLNAHASRGDLAAHLAAAAAGAAPTGAADVVGAGRTAAGASHLPARGRTGAGAGRTAGGRR
ncbi:MAG: mismatch-specific DNA-glycosylase [Acidimicrobiales bacterium]